MPVYRAAISVGFKGAGHKNLRFFFTEKDHLVSRKASPNPDQTAKRKIDNQSKENVDESLERSTLKRNSISDSGGLAKWLVRQPLEITGAVNLSTSTPALQQQHQHNSETLSNTANNSSTLDASNLPKDISGSIKFIDDDSSLIESTFQPAYETHWKNNLLATEKPLDSLEIGNSQLEGLNLTKIGHDKESWRIK